MRCIWVAQIATRHAYVRSHVLAARLALRRGEMLELGCGAVGGGLAERGGQEAGDEIGKGVDAVHEHPEARELVAGREDTAEGVHHDGQQRGEGAGDFLAGRACNEQVRERTGEQETRDDDEQRVETADVDAVCGLRVAV